MNSEEGFSLYQSAVMPKFIQFETDARVQSCNARCSFCPKQKMKPRPQMKWSEINRVIEKTIPTADACCPFLYQEPSLEPRLINILAYIKQTNPMCDTIVYSNMGGWSRDTIERIIREGNLDTLVTSLYAPTEELHRKYQAGVNYTDAWDNLRLWYETRKRLGATKPKLEWHYIAIPELMEHAQEYLKRITPLTDSGGICHYDSFHGLVPNLGDNEKYFGPPEKKRVPCSRLWSGMNILSNGDCVACCQDAMDSTPLGNVFKEEPRDIWRGPLFEELRRLHVEGKQNRIPLCRECIYWRHMEGKDWVSKW